VSRYLVTGAAGFIGFHLARRLAARGDAVIGVDSFTPYYDVSLKRRRAALLAEQSQCQMHEVSVADMASLERVTRAAAPDVIVHLAAQAGVRYSTENPRAYIDSNLVGTFNLLELARALKPRHLLIASTSSVYGANQKLPFEESDPTDHPLSLYAATKKSSEVLAHSYSHLWAIPTTMFRFFTVYGPWGRPDMALFIFTRRILAGQPIDVYNNGDMQRDFTYIDDLIEPLAALADAVPPDPRDAALAGAELASPVAPFRIVNIGHGAPMALLDFIAEIEHCLGRKSVRNLLPMQPGDVERTFASNDRLRRLVGTAPSTPIAVGVKRFVEWYRTYYGT
jgi:UDP-glucuronate 4-epimerase